MLGEMELRSGEKPNMVQHGGKQMLAVNQFPSGNVSIQNFGSTYRDIMWDGWFEGADAMDRMYRIGGMRQKGEPILFTTEAYTQNVIIAEFQADHRTNFYIPFSITLKRIVESVQVGDKDGDNYYVVRRYIPNITREQAQKQADNIRKSLEQQQFSGSFDCDYFPDMTNDRRIVLYGVGKGLSQIYHLSGVMIEGDKDTGIQYSVEFTNILEK